MRMLSRWRQFPADLFFRSVDERIYAVVRIVFAIAALLNLASLWPDRQVFFSDAGMVSADVAMSQASPVFLSIFSFARSEAAVTAVMLVSAFSLVLLMLGVGARVAVFWVLVWHISYIARSPLPLGGWDVILRCFAFLLLISPLGDCWTLPALLRGRGQIVPAAVSRHGLILMRLQVLVIYWHAELTRLLSPDPYWKNGEYLTYFMLSHHARWTGPWVLQHEGFLSFGTFGVQLAEVAIPVLLWVKKTRWWGVLLGIALHAGIAIMAYGFVMFSVVMTMTYAAFLRQEDLDLMGRWFKTRILRGGGGERGASS